MSINQDKMLQAVYDTLFSAFTSPPQGLQGQGASQAEQTYLTLNWPGQQIDFTSFANPWSPNNKKGKVEATENFSTLVDPIQSINPITAPNGQKISQLYQLVVNAKVVPPPPDPKAEERYNEAFNFLHTDGTDYDSLGNPITVKVDSPVYANYKRKLQAYNTAVATLMGNYFQYDMSDPESQRRWSFLGPTLQSSVQSALDDLRNAQQVRVEDALATLAQSSGNQVGVVFRKANDQFFKMQRAGLTDPTKSWWPCYAQPANWFAPSAADGWSPVTINSGSLQTSEHSDYTRISAGGSASWGLWSGGGSFDKQDAHQSMSKDTDSLKVSFKYSLVTIDRPWYNHLLFSIGGWSLTGYSKGGISNGNRDQSLGTPFPLLPLSFIAVRNLNIEANWGHEDSSLIQQSISTSARFGCGPFAISGNYSHTSTDQTFNSSFDGKTISNNGLQIIGWINTLVPYCPPA